MPDFVERFDRFKKKVADRKESKKKDRYAKHVSKLKHYSDGHVTSAPSDDNYRENYERIFGHK